MAISGNYSSPVTVNGFACRNCAEVDKAKRHIDPAKPDAGPFGINAHGKTSAKPDAAKNHFSADARHEERMAELHKARIQPVSTSAAAAYGGASGGASGGGAGQFVSLLA